MARGYTRRINAYTILQGQLRPHKMAGRTNIHLNSTADELRAELKKVEREVKFSEIGEVMKQRKERIDVGDIPNAAEVNNLIANKDILMFADEMLTSHMAEDRRKNKIFDKYDVQGAGDHKDIDHEELAKRDWVIWLKSNDVVEDYKLLLNRNPIGVNKRFVGGNVGDITPENFIKYFGEKTLSTLHKALDDMDGGMKFTFSVQLIMQSVNGTDVRLLNLFIRASSPAGVINHDEIEGEFKKQYKEVLKDYDTPKGPSNMTLFTFVSAYLHIDKYQPIAGGLYVKTPEFLEKKKCLVNVDNHLNEEKRGLEECFKYAVWCSNERPIKDAKRTSKYDAYGDMFDFTDIPFPTPCTTSVFKKFEKNNPGYALNVFTFPTKGKSLSSLRPAYISSLEDCKVLNIMLLYDAEDKGKRHYVSISSFDRLMCDGLHHAHATCPRCLYTFRGASSNGSTPAMRLAEHAILCKGINGGGCQKTTYPKPGTIKQFDEYHKVHMVPYAIYLDFESTLKTTNIQKGASSELVNEHVANSYCFIVIGPDGKEVKHMKRFYRGEDAAYHCLKDLQEVSLMIQPLLNQYPDHNLTAEEEEEFQKAEKCYLCTGGYPKVGAEKYCGREVSSLTEAEVNEMKYLKNHAKVRDHCHCSGAYRGAAHSKCNMKCRVKQNVDVFIHNGKNYDNHLLMQELHQLAGSKFDCIALNSEKYISFSIYHKAAEAIAADDEKKEMKKQRNSLKAKIKRREEAAEKAAEEPVDIALGALSLECEDDIDELETMQESLDELEAGLLDIGESEKSMKITFKDSCGFLTASLASLVENTPKEGLKNTQDLADKLNINMDLLTQKGIYPYNYLDDVSKFDDNVLPSQEQFYDQLSASACSDEDYKHACSVWDALGCKTFGEYHDFYLELDVYLLADVFENFRRFALETYGLDPSHAFTMPGFSWSALFAGKFKGGKFAWLELISDPDMYMAFESSLRGGVCVASNRMVNANHPSLPGYDEKQPKRWIRYDDANNLYGWAMIQKLPKSGFKWVDAKKYTTDYIMSMPDDGDMGAHLCVDVEYPDEIHDEHADFPMLPESREIELEELSSYSKAAAPDNYVPCRKLVPTLYNKSKYWIHYRNLKYAVEKGLKIIKVHKVIEYKQDAWMKPYIEFNTSMRAKARNDFEKDMFKLMNNSVFGKTMQNVRLQRDFKIVSTGEKRRWNKIISNPSYRGRGIDGGCIGGDLFVIEAAKDTLSLNMPMYVGSSILDLSKLHMQKFWYDFVRPRYPNAKLHYTDTDSLIYSIETEDNLAESFAGVKGSMFDTSGYPKEHKAYSTDNKKVLGKFKDEANGEGIIAVVCLAPKSYTMKTTRELTKKCKGTKKAVVKKMITYEDYEQCLQTGVGKSNKQLGFRSFGHKISTVETTKQSLNSFDSKRYWLDNINSLPFGHYKTREK